MRLVCFDIFRENCPLHKEYKNVFSTCHSDSNEIIHEKLRAGKKKKIIARMDKIIFISLGAQSAVLCTLRVHKTPFAHLMK